MTTSNYEMIEGGKHPIKAWTKGVPVEDKARQQLVNLANMPFIHKHVAVMPDVHFGMGATVGSVIATKGAIIPAAVGVDIGCVDLHTEYLSPSGWRRMVDYDGGKVMQFDPSTGEGSLVKPGAYVVQDCDEFLVFKSKYGINQKLTKDHKMLVYKIKGRHRDRVRGDMLASEFEKKHTALVQGMKAEIETSFHLKSDSSFYLSDARIRVQVMVHADCTLDGSKAVLHVKKNRKVVRARGLLTAAGIYFTEKVNAGVTSIRFIPPLPTKVFGQDWWASNEKQLQVISDEVLYWDGNHDDKCFYTRSKECADFIHYAFSATGRRGVLRADKHVSGEIDYRVYRFSNTRVGLAGAPKTPITREKSEDGKAYCFTVPTGYWVMRRGGNVAMTGNCGMMAQRTGLVASDLPDNLHALRTYMEEAIPHGRTNNGGEGDKGAWEHPPLDVMARLSDLNYGLNRIVGKHEKLAKAAARMHKHLGTLGTGNHFVEICLDEDQAVWIMLHSGSRGIGNAIGQYFIEKAKKDMERWFIQLPDKDLAYIPQGSELFNDYFNAVHWAQEYAAQNREVMMYSAIEALYKAVPKPFGLTASAVNCHHNYVQWERHFGENVIVTRKGAVNAETGVMGIIPGSMGAKSFIVRGKGNREAFNSCSHGAGRIMSRTEAQKTFTLADHEAATAGVECRKDADVLDETPKAYKDIDKVMAAQSDLVEVVHTLKQVVCVKG